MSSIREKLQQYGMEIVLWIIVLGIVIYLLPRNTVQIPDIADIQITGMDIDFVADEGTESLLVNEDAILTWTDDVLTWTPTVSWPIIVPDSGEQKSCTTPWYVSIAHGKSVLAYQQRSDDPTLCNVQRRVCDDGVLLGTYMQRSCTQNYNDPDAVGRVVSQSDRTNTVVTNNENLYQPTDPDRSTVTVNNRWQVGSTSSPSTTWSNTNVIPPPSTSPQGQNTPPRASDCITPWDTTVSHTQFVKAYKFNNGFTNLSCEVELRYCVNGTLEWSFTSPSCIYNEIALEDFLNDYYDPDIPSLQHLVETLYMSIQDQAFAQAHDDLDIAQLQQMLEDLYEQQNTTNFTY